MLRTAPTITVFSEFQPFGVELSQLATHFLVWPKFLITLMELIFLMGSMSDVPQNPASESVCMICLGLSHSECPRNRASHC
jgi:hypothetical protein